MKKFLKNAVLIMLITCFILNIVNLVWQYIEHYTVVQEVIKIAEEVRKQTITGQEAYQLLATVYSAGFGNKLAIQAEIIIASIVLGIIISMIVTFEEKSKIRILLIYILGLFLTALVPTIYDMVYYMDFNLFTDIIYNLEYVWKWYTLVFFVIYAIKLYINNRETRELNKISTEKQVNLEK